MQLTHLRVCYKTVRPTATCQLFDSVTAPLRVIISTQLPARGSRMRGNVSCVSRDENNNRPLATKQRELYIGFRNLQSLCSCSYYVF